MRTITSFVNGKWTTRAGSPCGVDDKYTGEPIAELFASSRATVDAALASATRAFGGTPISIADRVRIFEHVADAISQRSAEFAQTITAENGSTINEARKEVERAVVTLRTTSEEAKRIAGEIVPIEGAPGGAGKFAFMRRHPIGVVCAISAFNSPLNTPVHKIAPAIAAGNVVVVKPPTLTPISTAMLCDLFAEAGLPPGWLSYVTGSGDAVGEQLLRDERIGFYHFTGSTTTGARIASRIGLRRSSLELGSIAATIVCADADLELAVTEITRAGYAKAGQVCTSTQIVYAEAAVYGRVRDALVEKVKRLTFGDPRLESTNVGPLISAAEADRICAWGDEALAVRARRLVGGRRERSVVEPALFTQVPREAKLLREEVFGPVVTIVDVSSLAEAINGFNDTPYGLAAGIFTRDIEGAFHAASHLRAGTVHINAASSSRLDMMPFGGVKQSGHGKEGPKYAIEEMTEQRLTVWHGVA